MTANTPITLLVCALGGEGGGVLTGWLVEAARRAGYPVQATSIPGVAQRTGATTYYIEVFPQPLAALGSRRPVFSLSPVPGALDALVSSELLETARQITNGLPSPERTRILTSSARTFTTQERMQLGDGRVEEAELLQLLRRFSREHQVFDMQAVARETGTVVSAVMLGAIGGSGLLPIAREHFEAAVRAEGKGAEASLRGFARAWDIVAAQRQQAAFVQQVLQPAATGNADGNAPALPASLQNLIQALPPAAQAVATLGADRLLDYQDAAYAQLYLQRLQQVATAERDADPAGTQAHAATTETARWLALWMAYDDIVRVAHLKSRADRWQRVREEVKAGDDDLVKLYDHFKPGAPEFAALLPAALAQRVLAWDAARVARGQAPWALPLKIGTHGVGGLLALRVLAAMKPLRMRGSRHAAEQALISRWLTGIEQGLRRAAPLGLEVARCGRLIKGYGATNERGKENLLHVLDHLAHGADAQAAAGAVAAAREAALADDSGRALDATLQRHGAPARPVKPQPIRWVRPPKGLAGSRPN